MPPRACIANDQVAVDALSVGVDPQELALGLCSLIEYLWLRNLEAGPLDDMLAALQGGLITAEVDHGPLC
jgi:hypothetical protein